jgi:PIN domain nuclease of toxin-antitoxin system
MAVVLDTHAAIWYLLDAKSLSSTASRMIDQAAEEGSPVYLSSISVVEVVYLVERGRLPGGALERLLGQMRGAEATFRVAPLDFAVAEAVRHVPRTAVPDMPDRIIAATALHLGLPLITRDQRIQSAGIKTIW